MKSLAQYIVESEQTYEFKIKIATIEVDDAMLDRIEHALAAYDVATISKPKHLPITAKNYDFPSIKSCCDITILNATLRCPCTDEQIRAALGAQGRIPLANIVVTPKNQPEEMRRDEEEDETTQKNKEAILTKDLENVSGGQDQVGGKRLDSMLKELETRKMEFEVTPEKAPKTSNDFPQNNKSPTGSRKGSK